MAKRGLSSYSSRTLGRSPSNTTFCNQKAFSYGGLLIVFIFLIAYTLFNYQKFLNYKNSKTLIILLSILLVGLLGLLTWVIISYIHKCVKSNKNEPE